MQNLLVFLALLAACPLPAYAQNMAMPVGVDAPLVLKPVMIIRFNQPRVYFQKQLATIIRRAKQIKPDVVFDVVQYIPAQAAATETSMHNLQSVIASFSANGVGSGHLQVVQQPSTDVATDEVYIFVR